jgi:hypothetical protein
MSSNKKHWEVMRNEKQDDDDDDDDDVNEDVDYDLPPLLIHPFTGLYHVTNSLYLGIIQVQYTQKRLNHTKKRDIIFLG